MIDLRALANEQPLNLSRAAAYIGTLTGEKPHASTLWRWCLKGCKGVKLESICIGGKRYVTVSAIERFIEARSRTAATMDIRSAPAAVTTSDRSAPHRERHGNRRRQEIEAARQRLDELTGARSGPRDTPARTDPNRSA